MLTEREASSMARSIRRRIDICQLDLTGRMVVTEAATGAYATTAAAAAAAGAEVWAFAADSRYGTTAAAEQDVLSLMHALGIASKATTFVTKRADIPLERTDLITNSGVLRPIDALLIAELPTSAVIALMYEAWEARQGDIDYGAAAERGIPVIGVDEHHPACGTFDYLGDLVVGAVLRRGWPIRGMRFGVISDNAFSEPILVALGSLGAHAQLVDPTVPTSDGSPCDVVVIAVTPAQSTQQGVAATAAEITDLAIDSGAFGCVQVWGEIDADRLMSAGVMLEPKDRPAPGHQALAMSEAGFEAVVRLQVAGMAAALHGSEGGPLSSLAQELVWEAK